MFIKTFNIKSRGTWIPVALITIVLLLLSGNFMGCETENWLLTVNCDDCYGSVPDSANLIVHLTINAENDSVPLTFFKGDYEDGVIDWQDTATSEDLYLYSEVGQVYTVEATYKSGDQTIIAFDSDIMTIYDGATDCGSPCYIVKGGIFELQLME
jgi:hypothetical protein